MRKIKKLVATLLAATMVMAMGVTAFAAETLANGTYTANQNLYKNSDCSTTSMGDAAVNDLKAEIVVNGATSTLKVHTHEITYRTFKCYDTQGQRNNIYGSCFYR